LPVAVNLKRFFTPLLVLSLGIFVSCCLLRAPVNGAQTIANEHGSPYWPARPISLPTQGRAARGKAAL
jgi:hypothetical protein